MALATTVQTKFGKICRICLKQQDEMHHLFSKEENENNDSNSSNIVGKITSLAQVEVSEEDSLPNYICYNCEQQVNQCYEFQALILESDQTLRTCLNSLETNTRYKIEEITSADVDYQFIEIPLEQTDTDADEMETIWVPTYNNSKVWKLRSEADAQANLQTNKSQDKDVKPLEIKQKVTSLEYSDSRRTKVQRYFKCYCCEDIFMSDEERKEHMLTHVQKSEKISVEVLIKCQLCDLPFSDEYELKYHILSHFGENSKIVSEKPSKPSSQIREIQITDHSYQAVPKSDQSDTKTKGVRYKCASCSKGFKSKIKMEDHVKTHSDLVYSCKLCSKVFSRSASLSQHVMYHMRTRRFECDLCNKVFTKRTELRYHKGTHLDVVPQCEICNKTFQNMQSLKMHTKRHEKGDRFNCSYCGKRYFTNSELARHVQTHTGERNYPCNLCNMSFMSKPELTRHMKYHGGEKKWACDTCGKRYFESGHLKIHMKSHTGEKPFVCSVCNKGFVTKCKMVRHAKIHERIVEVSDTNAEVNDTENADS